MAECPVLPDAKVREIINKTVETGNEHAFVKCADGSTSDIVKGGKSSLDIQEAVESCDLDDGPIDVVHTHPNGIEHLSKQDREVAAADAIKNVCVAVEGGNVRCESVETCESEVND